MYYESKTSVFNNCDEVNDEEMSKIEGEVLSELINGIVVGFVISLTTEMLKGEVKLVFIS